MGKRVAVYLRVSTSRQAEKDLSIPDQRRQAEAYCERKGWELVSEYIEPGASATDDKRPAFQKLIDEGTDAAAPFDIVVVHSFSRFFRDAYQFEFYRRKLSKHGVEVCSITQELGHDPMSDMVRQILNLFDEYQSKETAKHVLRSMKENARQGYWNGSRPPYGYKAVPVEFRGDVVKKKLDIDMNEEKIVRQIFDLYQGGPGIRAIADTLNSKGLRHRNGRRFSSSLVHQILTRTSYKGLHHFNKKSSKTRKRKDPSEWVAFETPVIIAPEVFDKVQDMLAQRRPTNTPPRVVNGPTLLTGVAKCGTCGGGMTLRTGKGGRYRYYTCNARVTEGKSACDGRNIPMAKLDTLVLDHLGERIFKHDRLAVILEELIRRNAEKSDEYRDEEKQLRKELRSTEEKIDRLYDALAEGVVENTDGFKRNLSKLEQRKDELIRQVSSRKRRRDVPTNILTSKNIEKFSNAAKAKLQDKDSAFRKQYLRMFVDRVEVRDDQILISGPKTALANAIANTTKPDTDKVPSYVSEWWSGQDSNPQPDGCIDSSAGFCTAFYHCAQKARLRPCSVLSRSMNASCSSMPYQSLMLSASKVACCKSLIP